MTIAVVTNNIDDSKRGPDKNILPNFAGSIAWINGDTESLPINVKGFRAIGISDPGTITGPATWAVHVAATETGAYAPLNITAFTAGVNVAYGTSFIAEWNFCKIVPDVATTNAGAMPFCLS